MKLIVGLGNPGAQYTLTRHNIGFLLIDSLLEKYGKPSVSKKFNSHLYSVMIDAEKCVLVKPQTYMNNSGQALQLIMNFYKVEPKDCIIIFDDFELEFGTCRIREKGSAGTHNGMRSIIQSTKRNEFARIRMGVGPLDPLIAVRDFVLQNFSKEQQNHLGAFLSGAGDIVEQLVTDDVLSVMNAYNNKSLI